MPELKKIQPKTVEKISELAGLLRENQILNDFLFEKIKRNAVSLDGTNLDLELFFSYNKPLRRFILHRLCPQSSFRQIDLNNAVLEKELRIKKKRNFPILRLIRGTK